MKHGAAPFMPTSKQRISINLEDGEYAELSALAEKHDISMAWIGRKAILDFLDRNREAPIQLPLDFAEHGNRLKWLKTASR